MPFTLTPQAISTHAFTQEQFGANILGNRDRVDEEGTYDDKVEELGVEHIRYPGGSLTEFLFDIENPDRVDVYSEDQGTQEKMLPYSEFMQYAEAAGKSVTVVLPTRTNLGSSIDANGDRYAEIDESALRGFVKDTLDGQYGEPAIQAFEIGNEYWGAGRMSAVEYGRVASEMSVIVKDEIRSHPDYEEKFTDTDVVVQMGQNYNHSNLSDRYEDMTPGEEVLAFEKDYGIEIEGWRPNYAKINNDLILKEFDTQEEQDAVDAVVAHIYSKAPESMQSRIWDMSQINETGWEEVFGEDLTRYVTEWNQSASTGRFDRADDYGLKNAKELLEIAETFPENHVEAAHVWAVQQNTASDLANLEGSEGLTTTGEMFKMMAESLPGKREVVLGKEDDSLEKEAEDDQSGDEVHAFADSNELVLFAFAGVENDGNMQIDLNGLISSYGEASITRLGVQDGENPGNNNADVLLEELDPDDLIKDGVLNAEMKPFEILHITFNDADFTSEFSGMMDDAEAREEGEHITDAVPGEGGWDDWTAEYGVDHGDADGSDDIPDRETGGGTSEDGEDEDDENEDEENEDEDEDDMGDVEVDIPDIPDSPTGPSRPSRPDDDDDEDKDEHEEDNKDASGTDVTCFVATAAYTDPLHPDVCDLRRLRDEHLVNYRAGRAFIAFYWKIGPVLAGHVRGRPVISAVTRAALAPLIWSVRRMVLK